MAAGGKPISIIVEYQVEAGRRALFLERLGENCRETLADDGCERMEINEPIEGDGRTVFLTERWREQAAIDAHRAKPGHERQHQRVDELVASKRVSKCVILGG